VPPLTEGAMSLGWQAASMAALLTASSSLSCWAGGQGAAERVAHALLSETSSLCRQAGARQTSLVAQHICIYICHSSTAVQQHNKSTPTTL
jgi:hypothetical protein